MALSTYTELQAAIASSAHRSDLTSVIVDCIALAEAQMNRRLRVNAMIEREAAFTIDGEYETLPTGFNGVRSFALTTSPTLPLIFVPASDLDVLKAGYAPTGRPTHYSIVGDSFQFAPAPDATYTATLSYYSTIPALSSNGSNWLLTAHPDAYLYGSLVQLGQHVRNPEQTAVWAELYTRAIADIEAQDARASYSAPRTRHRAF